ncbi:MAG: hypothetical protein KDK37_18040 [Leptospiraceae bacterium]|nr:hypothetical protein [Leptospiraceae bacterium]
MLQEDFSPPYDGHFFLRLLLYIGFLTFCVRLFGGGCLPSQQRRIIWQDPIPMQCQELPGSHLA